MSKPNIVWIYCDELRADALGCYGNRYAELRTPNFDSIAESGVRFDRCFCNSPLCVPSRTSTLTGLYPEDTGVYANEAWWESFKLEDPPITFPEVFAEHGYTTANFGKTHTPQALQPWMHCETEGGGERFFEHVDPEDLETVRLPGISSVIIAGRYPLDKPYPSEPVTTNALRWLESAEEPYLLRLSYFPPHPPVLPVPPYDTQYLFERFRDSVQENSATSDFEKRFVELMGGMELSAREIFLAQVSYYGLVAWIDAQVGEILRFLRGAGKLEKTILVVGTDHGVSLGEGGRYCKHVFAPESHRVPRLLSWPGTIPSGQVHSGISEGLDLPRTLFALAGIKPPDQFKGRDLLSDEAPEAVFSTVGFGFRDSMAFPLAGVGDYADGRGWPRRACIRTSQYRLDKTVGIDGRPATTSEEDIFLSDVQADPEERRNLANNPDFGPIVAELSQKLDKHIADAVEVPWEYTRRS